MAPFQFTGLNQGNGPTTAFKTPPQLKMPSNVAQPPSFTPDPTALLRQEMRSGFAGLYKTMDEMKESNNKNAREFQSEIKRLSSTKKPAMSSFQFHRPQIVLELKTEEDLKRISEKPTQDILDDLHKRNQMYEGISGIRFAPQNKTLALNMRSYEDYADLDKRHFITDIVKGLQLSVQCSRMQGQYCVVLCGFRIDGIAPRDYEHHKELWASQTHLQIEKVEWWQGRLLWTFNSIKEAEKACRMSLNFGGAGADGRHRTEDPICEDRGVVNHRLECAMIAEKGPVWARGLNLPIEPEIPQCRPTNSRRRATRKNNKPETIPRFPEEMSEDLEFVGASTASGAQGESAEQDGSTATAPLVIGSQESAASDSDDSLRTPVRPAACRTHISYMMPQASQGQKRHRKAKNAVVASQGATRDAPAVFSSPASTADFEPPTRRRKVQASLSSVRNQANANTDTDSDVHPSASLSQIPAVERSAAVTTSIPTSSRPVTGDSAELPIHLSGASQAQMSAHGSARPEKSVTLEDDEDDEDEDDEGEDTSMEEGEGEAVDEGDDSESESESAR
ncbi:uncharacterized protein K460DRAFT_352370 [Cucurbitaria berberidis CBS 394.84]|uniref:Uncharacterized protein n=1 Tax=Cucurbitaria berberidis CBS 394.84 TaxID=1168544 RepID=A0A9P4GKD9_9PLEO|nr:uncharacterized protein K460DRAFT_352370 [Cucurbitaria berberidis CBS 394.84]KAF1847200.1 hypothetical protein K460DRAFT_352370 [Cucurbitaria berberidis CBS 394.84]